MLLAIDDLWKFTGELFEPAEYEKQAAKAGIGTDISLLKSRWQQITDQVFEQATLPKPSLANEGWNRTKGKEGQHTEHLGYILAEMQFLQRAYPGCEW